MERIQITETLSFSRIVYGMWRIGDDADTSPEHIRNKIEACLDQGITNRMSITFIDEVKVIQIKEYHGKLFTGFFRPVDELCSHIDQGRLVHQLSHRINIGHPHQLFIDVLKFFGAVS